MNFSQENVLVNNQSQLLTINTPDLHKHEQRHEKCLHNMTGLHYNKIYLWGDGSL